MIEATLDGEEVAAVLMEANKLEEEDGTSSRGAAIFMEYPSLSQYAIISEPPLRKRRLDRSGGRSTCMRGVLPLFAKMQC